MAAISLMEPLQCTHPLQHQNAQRHLLRPHAPLLHQAPDILSRPLLLPGPAGCFSQQTPGWGRTNLDDIPELCKESRNGKIWQSNFLLWHPLFWSSASDFVSCPHFCFPWVSFSVKWRIGPAVFTLCYLKPFKGWAGRMGSRWGDSERRCLQQREVLLLQIKWTRVRGPNNLTIMSLDEASRPFWLNAGTVCPASQAPHATANVTHDVVSFSLQCHQRFLCTGCCAKRWAFSSEQNRARAHPRGADRLGGQTGI